MEPTADQWKSISFSMPGSHGFGEPLSLLVALLPYLGGFNPGWHLFRYSPDDLAEPRPGVIFVGGPNPFKRVESLCKLVLEFSTSTEFFGVGMFLIDVATCCEMKNIITNVPFVTLIPCVSNGAKGWSINHRIPRWTPQMAPWGLTILWLWNFGYQQRSFKKIWVAKHVKQRAHLNNRLCVHSLKQHSEIPYLQANTTDLTLLAQTALAFSRFRTIMILIGRTTQTPAPT